MPYPVAPTGTWIVVAETPKNTLVPNVGAVVARQLIVARVTQSRNAKSARLVKLSGRLMDVRSWQLLNANLSIVSVPPKLVTLVR